MSSIGSQGMFNFPNGVALDASGNVVTDATLGTVYTAARPPSSTCTFIAGTQDGGTGTVLGMG